VPYLSASAVVIHYEQALYQVYGPFTFSSSSSSSNNRIYIAPYGRNFRGAGRSQINEDTAEPSLTPQAGMLIL